MHPVANIRGQTSTHLAGRHIVLGVSGSIAAVKTVELARELIRHGAHVTAVMSDAAAHIIHPEALHFGTGAPVITRLTGAVEHVALLGDVPEKADLFLVAPATANTLSKMALGIDDGPVTTCATVAIGTGVPIVVAPAMHEAMLDHAIVADHRRVLEERLGVVFVEPERSERKAKLADVEVIVEAVIQRLARQGALLSGQRCLVISGSTEEAIDPVRVVTNRSSGQSGYHLATELARHGGDVTLWQGAASHALPPHLAPCTRHYRSHADLLAMVEGSDLSMYDQVWMPAAINDYAPRASQEKIHSEQQNLTLVLQPLAKIIARVRDLAPGATLVAFKAETDPDLLLERARDRLVRHHAQFVVANTSASFESSSTEAWLVTSDGWERFAGTKQRVMGQLVLAVSGAEALPTGDARRTGVRAGSDSGSRTKQPPRSLPTAADPLALRRTGGAAR